MLRVGIPIPANLIQFEWNYEKNKIDNITKGYSRAVSIALFGRARLG